MKSTRSSGFTLIEVLVATFILVVMVLILGKVYHQASVAWSAGFRRAEGNMTGRSAVGFMAREIMNACADNEVFWETSVWNGYQTIRFITLTGEPSSTERAARWIEYTHTGDGALMRTEKRSDPNRYGQWQDYGSPWPLVTNVASIYFTTPDTANYLNGKLPAWVKIQLTLNRADDVSGVGARSMGPDGTMGNDDDVRSW